jgi:hypothetical protein
MRVVIEDYYVFRHDQMKIWRRVRRAVRLRKVFEVAGELECSDAIGANEGRIRAFKKCGRALSQQQSRRVKDSAAGKRVRS